MEQEAALTIGGMFWRLLAVMVLVLANGFFVAAEFALVGARRSKVDQEAAEGSKAARVVQEALKHLDRYISATQLGITLASLALGWIGKPALAVIFDRMFAALGLDVPTGAAHTAASVTMAFALITFLHIVLGELAPKSLALIAPEAVSKRIARPLMVFSWIMQPGIWLLNGAANKLLRLFGVQPMGEMHHVHSPEELRLLVTQARAHGTLDESDSLMLAGVFDFHEKRARDVMLPRTEVSAIPIDATEQELWDTVRRERYSRYPVYRDSLDDVEGVFLVKDLVLRDPGDKRAFALKDYVREVLYVPDSRPAERVLDDLRKSRAGMAVVLDEYGGTAGILTMEDLVEEVVGDIADEYDLATRTSIESEGVLELAGNLSLIDVRSDYKVRIPEGDWTTLGGYVFSRLGRIPRVGDRATYPGGELEVVAMDGRRVAAVRVIRKAEGGAA